MSEYDDRKIAYERVDRYYEIMGYDYDPYSDEYRERFNDELNKIRDGE